MVLEQFEFFLLVIMRHKEISTQNDFRPDPNVKKLKLVGEVTKQKL